MRKKKYGKYNKFDVVYANFGKNPHGIQGGIRPGVVISCDASNHDGAPQVSVVPLSTKLKDIPVHVVLDPKDVSEGGINKVSDFMPEDTQTIAKSHIIAKSGTVIENSGMREEIDKALIKQFDLLPIARKMVMEELKNGQLNQEDK
jgi:mRNA interferase MazF